MRKHPVSGNGVFEIVNVAGIGDEEEKSEDALKKGSRSIDSAGEDGYTITLSCGKLTYRSYCTRMDSLFMLSGSFSTYAAITATIFRVNHPVIKMENKTLLLCIDFAPDRT